MVALAREREEAGDLVALWLNLILEMALSVFWDSLAA
jgi:hypothetical protein